MIKKKTRVKIITIVSIVLAFFVLVHYFVPARLDAKIPVQTVVTYVVDGDTIVLKNREKVRLIGVDTPEKYESEKLFRMARQKGVRPEDIIEQGKKASEFTRDLVLGKEVLLVVDKNNEYIKHRDKYGRLLAYVYILGKPANRDHLVHAKVGDKSTVFLNASIINAGYGEVFRRFRYKHKDYFYSLEAEAKKEGRGLWE